MVISLLLALAATGPVPGPTIRDILEVTDISGLAASPDGRWIAYRTEQASAAANDYRILWYVAPVDGSSTPRRIGDGGGALYDWTGTLQSDQPVWSPASDAIYTRALIKGEVQVWRFPIHGAARQVTRDPSNVKDVTMSPDSRALIYHVGASRQALDAAEQVADDEGVLVDGSVDIEQPISRGAWRDGHLASERFTGNWFARGDLLWRAPVREVRVAIADGHGSIAAAAPKKAFSPTFARIDDRWQLSLKRPEGATIRCDISACRVGTPVAAVPLDDGEHVLVTTEDTAQAERLSLWRPDTGQAVTLRQSDGLLSGDRRDDTPCAIAKRMAVCVAASANAPPRLITIDLANGRIVTLMDPNASLRATIGTPVRRLDWKSPLGTPFTAQLILPRGALPSTGVPLFITYYDCPGFLRGGLGDEYPMLPLANAGIAALCINKPHTPSDQRDASWDYDQARVGITTIVAQLAREGVVDPHHVGMGGLSFGGEITMVMAMQTRLLAAASISTMQLEPTFYWANTIGDRDTAKSMRATWNVGDPDGDATGWKRISPALNVEQIRVPLLMQMPEQEARSSIELIAKLSQSNVPNETIAYAHEAHLKRLPRHKEATYQRNLDWFRFWLQGYVDPDPAKADQYRRWSSMAARWHHDQGLDRAHP